MYYIGLDIHKKTISYCVKDVAGCVHREGKIGSRRRELDAWLRTLLQPRMMAMEATIFTGWIYDYLLPHAEKVKVAHPLMLRAIAAAKKKNDKIDAAKNTHSIICEGRMPEAANGCLVLLRMQGPSAVRQSCAEGDPDQSQRALSRARPKASSFPLDRRLTWMSAIRK